MTKNMPPIKRNTSLYASMEAGQYLLRSRAGFVHVLSQIVDVGLHVAELKGFHTGDSDAGAYVAHEIEDAGGVSYSLFRDLIVAYGGQRHKNQPQTYPLQHQRPGEIPEPNVQVEEGDAEHCGGSQ